MCLPSKVDVNPSWTIRSTSAPSPSLYPNRAFVSAYGAFDIDSIPPATITLWSPDRIIWSAISTARMLDAQTLLIVSAGSETGRPAPIAAWRAGAWPAPPWSTWPMIAYSTSSSATSTRSSAARIAIAPSSVA